ncbi:ATP-binding sensor histidine kinase [Candidatus Albibeggiatoa sp. nov. NOAA]|uniref:trifunctional serine/threonine-protein kinase/ATP-binding protein/sensor histidine kinase n=1 Tax=Candidatus Albibeggiatoa sp. nov. NOAA TaxID=3162724 RepID=UPI003302D5BB|nr:trifunctional serine/threonine-protein kinase/ATP-binding protein/sensor histidine kinase [Thiotrichaceae bacterium]
MNMLPGYEVRDKIHEGNKSLIYRARRTADNANVILKILTDERPTPERIARFRQEFEIHKKLEDVQGVAHAYALDHHQHRWFMVLEDFGGQSLDQYFNKQPIGLINFLKISIDISEILARVHQKHIIHRDINPSNIVIDPKTNEIKLIDFGLSSVLLQDTSDFIAPSLEGTFAYMSPEQTGRINQVMDYRTDFYSLGVTLYELITQRLPFDTSDPIALIHAHIAKPPEPPHQIKPTIPKTISSIIMKLLQKNVAERYQSAFGIQADLVSCLMQLEANGDIENITLGENDISPILRISQKLYGREFEVDTLLAAFEQVRDGTNQLLMLAGYPGVGKTALVKAVYDPLTDSQGYFVRCCFERNDRQHQPYRAILQAFQDLVKQLLIENESRLEAWGQRFNQALGINGRVITDVIPELEFIIGKQACVTRLSTEEHQARLSLTLQRFILTFTQPKRPLVIFLDNLHWADIASLNLLVPLMTSADNYLFIIAAYQDNNSQRIQLLMQTFEDLEAANVTVKAISLLPLTLSSITQLVIDTLSCGQQPAQALGSLILEKTGGNPYFINEFLKALHAQKLIQFDLESLTWDWDLDQIHDEATMTENVVDLLASKIQRLPDSTQQFLKLAACIGYKFSVETLEMLSEQAVASLWEAAAEGLIVPAEYKSGYVPYHTLSSDGNTTSSESYQISTLYRFTHDRIQQAAYSLVPADQKQHIHKQVGELLLKMASAKRVDPYIFDIVNQLNEAIPLIVEPEARLQLAHLNLLAGRKSRFAAAYSRALNYLSTGILLLGEKSWERQYMLTLSLTIEAAETAFLCGDTVQMEGLAEIVLHQAQTVLDKIQIYELKIHACINSHKHYEAVNMAQQVLHQLNIRFPDIPNNLALFNALLRNRWLLRRRKVMTLTHLPVMTDSSRLAALRILSSIGAPAYHAVPELIPLLTCKAVNLCLRYGNAPVSSYVYASYGVILCSLAKEIPKGYEFGQLALDVVASANNKSLELKTRFTVHAQIRHWCEPIHEIVPALKQVYQDTLETGDLNQAALMACSYYMGLFLSGQNLELIDTEIQKNLSNIGRLKQVKPLIYSRICRQSVQFLLQTDIDKIEIFKENMLLQGSVYDESTMLAHHVQENDQTALFNLYFHKMLLCYWFDAYPDALSNAEKAEPFINSVIGLPIYPSFYFYSALIYLTLLPQAAANEKELFLYEIKRIQKKLKYWAKHSPDNHAHKYQLINAEIAAKDNCIELAKDCYEHAAQLAQKHGYLQEEALICERAAQFLFRMDKPRLAQVYLNDAHYAYTQWGAKAKVLLLEKQYSQYLIANRHKATTTSAHFIDTAERNHSAIDLASVLKSVQTIASEIVIEQLLKKQMKIVIENAGAQRGALILDKKGQWVVEAEGSNDIAVLQSTPITEFDAALPITLINYVVRSQEAVVLHHAVQEGDFTFDPHFVHHKAKSVLCLPLINQGKLQGILYLENNLATNVFTPDRLEILNIFSSQMAISIENARLYANLEDKVQERTLEIEMQKQELSDALEKLQSAQQQLVESEKMAALGNLVAGVAHEINTPVGIGVTAASKLKSLTTDLQKLYQDNKMKRSDLEKYLRSASQGAEFVLNNLSRASELIQGFKQVAVDQSTEQQRKFELREYLDEILLSLHPKLKRTKHSISIHCEQKIILSSYPSAFYQIITNLIMNSLTHGFESRPQGQISLHAEIINETDLRLIYQDNGQGIAEPNLKNIFEPFFTTNRQGGGSGLGLHIVYNLVTHKLGGRIQCDSEFGEGVTFTMQVPLETA